jgi:site-specific recombinase XerD
MKRIITLVATMFNRKKGTELKTAPKFLDLLREYIDVYCVENDLEETTKRHYDKRLQNIQLYFASENITDITIDEIRHRHIDGLYLFLKSNLRSRYSTVSNRHASRHMELCRNVTAYALKKELIINDPLTSVRGKRDPQKKIFTLRREDVKKWIVYRHQNKYTQLAADLFTLQMTTGLSYMDIWQHKIYIENGVEWISDGRGKNDNPYSVMLNHYAKSILEKYNFNMPYMANQTYNEKIKIIGEVLKIQNYEKITTHVARKTFATLSFNNGSTLEGVAIMLGHKKTQTTSTFYVDMGKERLLKEREQMGDIDLIEGIKLAG